MDKIKIGILGYGNLGRGVECAVKQNPDMELAGIFTRRDPSAIKPLTPGVRVLGIDALEEVIYHIETYDVTTIRASTPMFLMSRKIKSLGVKMVLSGEGSDEIFGGYLYFHKAPNKEEFHQETCRKVY